MTRQTLNTKKIEVAEIPVPPLMEQRRLVAKLERTLGRVEQCHERLVRVPLILKRFREAVLEAAVSGRLTEEWRDTVDQGPADWRSSTIGEIAKVIDPNPTHRYPSYTDGTIPLLATEQMTGLSGWNTSTAKLTTVDFWEGRVAAHGFLDDDIIFARKGRLGLPRHPPKGSRYAFSHTVFIVRADASKVAPSYLLWFLRQQKCVDWLLMEMNSNTGVPTLGKAFMERLPIAVPSLAEQAEIVRRVDELFALADQLEANYLAAVERVKKLTPAVLAKAFRGELVAQDPSDEPAEKLLERIRAQREAEGPAGLAGQGRGRRAGSGGRGRGGVKTGAPGKKRGRRPRAS